MPIALTQTYQITYRTEKERRAQEREAVGQIATNLRALLDARMGQDHTTLPCKVWTQERAREFLTPEKVRGRYVRWLDGYVTLHLTPDDPADEALLERDPDGFLWTIAVRVRQGWKAATGHLAPPGRPAHSGARRALPQSNYYQEYGSGPHFGKVYPD